MRERTKKQLMQPEQTLALLKRAKTGHLGTTRQDGAPYVVPVQFVLLGGKIYLHGAREGEKLENLLRDGRVCFEVCQEFGLSYTKDAQQACAVNTKYESAIVFGEAKVIEDAGERERALRGLVEKYVPEFAKKEFSAQALARTAVIAIENLEYTGKEFRGR